jgi:hypothetical protein
VAAVGGLYKAYGRGHVAVHLVILHPNPLARPSSGVEAYRFSVDSTV